MRRKWGKGGSGDGERGESDIPEGGGGSRGKPKRERESARERGERSSRGEAASLKTQFSTLATRD